MGLELGRTDGVSHGGIFESRTGEGKWRIVSMEAEVDTLKIVRTFGREREKKRKKLKDRPLKGTNDPWKGLAKKQ